MVMSMFVNRQAEVSVVMSMFVSRQAEVSMVMSMFVSRQAEVSMVMSMFVNRQTDLSMVMSQDPLDSMTGGSNPVRSTRKKCEFSPSQKCYADSLSVCLTPSVYL